MGHRCEFRNAVGAGENSEGKQQVQKRLEAKRQNLWLGSSCLQLLRHLPWAPLALFPPFKVTYSPSSPLAVRFSLSSMTGLHLI